MLRSQRSGAVTPWEGPITIKIARRRIMAAVGGAAAMWPILGQAQEPGLKRWRIGCVFPGSPETSKPLAAVLEQRLAELGYQNGRNINIVIRFVAPQSDIVESAITALQAAGLNIVSIEDVTPIPHNGCRARKKRRV